MDDPIALPTFPAPLSWLNRPVSWQVDEPDALTITAGAQTDLFVDPAGTSRRTNAPALVGQLAGDFTLSARVRVDLAGTYDAGVLALYGGEESWAKLCLERSPQGRPTIVSVVTRGVSDDCNSFPVEGGDVRLRVARVGPAYAFHAAAGGDGFWHLIRYFALDGDPAVGFLAQAPTGEGCTVRFEQIRYEATRLAELRDGS